jgi:5-methylcytosine-specific restriction endonuclease McrA
MAARSSSHERYGPGWPRLRELVFARKGRRCHWCGRPATTVDHVVARVLGGAHDLSNLVPSCAKCNYSRGAALGNRLRPRRMRRPPPRSQRSRDW